MTENPPSKDEAPAGGTWLLRKLSSLGGQVVGAFVTTAALSLGFMIFNDYIAPPPDLAGRWKFTVIYQDTAHSGFKDLRVTYQALLIQEGLDLSGSGEKLSDRSPAHDPVDYQGARRTNIEVTGNIKRNYFSRDALVLHYKEAGRARDSSTLHQLVHFDPEAMCGCFQTTIADTSGAVWWQRSDSRAGLYEPVERPKICADVGCVAAGASQAK